MTLPSTPVETMGHCDEISGKGAEQQIIQELLQAQYMLVMHSHHNTYMMHKDAYEREVRLQQWAARWVCSKCRRRACFPYTPELVCPCCAPACDLQTGPGAWSSP